MKIAVCVKQVPDTWAEKRLRPEDSTLDRESADGVMNELDEYAVEEALKLTEAHGGEVVVVTMGPDRAGETVRKALSMGADAGIHVVDDGLRGSDAIATSAVLAGAIAGRDFDLVIFGSESTDARMSVVPAMVAERLGWAQLTFAQQVDVSRQRRDDRAGHGVGLRHGRRPRRLRSCRSWRRSTSRATPPSRGSWRRRRSRSRRWPIADTGVDAAQVGAAAAWSAVKDFAARPPKAAGVVVTDEGDGGVKVATYLSEQKFI